MHPLGLLAPPVLPSLINWVITSGRLETSRKGTGGIHAPVPWHRLPWERILTRMAEMTTRLMGIEMLWAYVDSAIRIHAWIIVWGSFVVRALEPFKGHELAENHDFAYIYFLI